MIFHIDTLLPALEVNGMALLQGKPMVEVAFVAVYTFPAMFSTVFVHCKASSHYNPWTRPLHPFHTLLPEEVGSINIQSCDLWLVNSLQIKMYGESQLSILRYSLDRI